MAKKKAQIELKLEAREPADPETIGVIFDYYRSKGMDKLPDNVIINADKFKSKSK